MRRILVASLGVVVLTMGAVYGSCYLLERILTARPPD